MSRILKNTDSTLTQTFYVNGTATDVSDVTVTISRENGTALYTDQSTTNNGDGTYDFAITDTDTNRVDRLRCEWTATGSDQTLTSHVEVVGNHLVPEADVRAFDPALANTTKFPDADILNVRDMVTDRLEHWTHRSWVPRFRLGMWSGTGTPTLWTHDAQQSRGGSSGQGMHSDIQQFITADVGGTTVSSGVEVLDGGFYRTSGIWDVRSRSDWLNIRLEWEYGLESIQDGVDRIALILIRDYLTRGQVTQNALSASNDFETIRFIQEGGPMGNVSKHAEVNDWVKRHNARTPLVI